VGGIFIVVFEKEGTDEALKVWGALGTLIGVLVGAIPTYFFGQQAAAAAKEETKRVHEAAANEAVRWQDALERSQDATKNAQQAQGKADEKVRSAEAQVQALLPHIAPQRLKEMRDARGDLFSKS
jgi:hypothetical protein